MSSPTTGTAPGQSLSIDTFINHPEVVNCFHQLDAAFSKGNRPFIVSDVYDED
jgi:hypothetical protein